MAVPTSNTVSKPYFDVPFLPFDEQDPSSRHGAQFFSNVKQLQVGFGQQVFRVDRDGMWAGAETFADAPWSVDWGGNMIANSVTISGYIPTGGALADVGVGNITGTYIANGAIVTDKLAANSVVASKISVSTLSAISANIGTVTAGTITGVTITGGVIQTSAITTVERARMLNSKFEVLNEDNTVSGYFRGYKDELSGYGRSEIEVNYVSILAHPGSTDYASIYYATGTGGGWKFDINDGSDDVLEFFGVPVTQELGIGSVFVGYNSLTNSSGILDWSGSGFSVTSLFLDTGNSTNPTSSGQINYYDGGTKGFRGYVNGFTGQFDMTSV